MAALGWAQGFWRGPIPSAFSVPGSRAILSFLCLRVPQGSSTFSSHFDEHQGNPWAAKSLFQG